MDASQSSTNLRSARSASSAPGRAARGSTWRARREFGSSAGQLTAASGVLAGRCGAVSKADRTLLPLGFRTFATLLDSSLPILDRVALSSLRDPPPPAPTKSCFHGCPPAAPVGDVSGPRRLPHLRRLGRRTRDSDRPGHQAHSNAWAPEPLSRRGRSRDPRPPAHPPFLRSMRRRDPAHGIRVRRRCWTCRRSGRRPPRHAVRPSRSRRGPRR